MNCIKALFFSAATFFYLQLPAQINIIKPPVLTDICPGGIPVTLGSITIEETNKKDIDTTNLTTGADGYYQITIGQGFQFASAGSITYVGLSTACVSITQPIVSSSSGNRSLYFHYKMTKPDYANDLSAFVWSGISILANDTTLRGTSADIVRTHCTVGTDAPQLGNNPVNSKVHATVQAGKFSADLVPSASVICSGNYVTLLAYPDCAGCSYEFINATNGNTFSHTSHSYTTGNLNSNTIYKVRITKSGCSDTSAMVDIIVNPTPVLGNDFSSNSSSSLRFNFNSTDPAQTLTSYVNNPQNYELKFLPGNNCDGCIYKSFGNVYDFLPSAYYPGSRFNVAVNYTVTNAQGCASLPASLSQAFQIQGAALQGPSFASPSGPFCEGTGQQNITIDLGKKRAIKRIVANPAYAIDTTASRGKLIKDHTYGTLMYIDYDSSSGYEIIKLNPNVYTSSYTIGIKVIYADTITYGYVVNKSDTGTFSVTPGIRISGMPTLYYDDVCSSNKDTVSITGIPSGGMLTFEKSTNYNKSSVIPTFVPLANKLSNIPVANYEKNFVEKFVPYSFFKDSLNAVEYYSAIKVNYSLSNSSGSSCPNTNISRIYYFRNPPAAAKSVEISIINTAAVCTGDTVIFQITNPDYNQPSNMGIYGFQYQDFYLDFGDGTYSPYGHAALIDSHTTIIKHKYVKSGDYKVRLKTSTFCPCPRCEQDTIITSVVGAYPSADYIIKNPVLNGGTKFISLSTVANPANAFDTLKIWHWKFDNTNLYQAMNTDKAVHQYADVPAEPYTVVHIAETNYGCKDTAIRSVPVFPFYSKENYYNNFEGRPYGWYQSGDYHLTEDSSSWKNIVPKGKVLNGKPGNKAWVTDKESDYGYSKYYQSERSWVESPVFYLDTYERPMLSFKNWGITQNQLDGACLQYAVNDTSVEFGKEIWKTINPSQIKTGWYNSDVIVSKPGGDYPGWSGSTGKDWSQSSINLDEIKKAVSLAFSSNSSQNNGIRFRFAFASNADNAPGNFDGFAFDDFFLGNRNRKILLEEFCDDRHYEKDFLKNTLGSQVVRMQYHVRNLVPDDAISNQNPAEPSARALLYGIDLVPQSVIDGKILNSNLFFNSANSGTDAVFKRSLQQSPFNIDIQHIVSGNALGVVATIEKDTTTSHASLVAQIAIIEDSVISNGNLFTNVVRNFLPDASGHHIGKWTINQILTAQWKPFARPQSGLKIVVFIQDEDTKEIYQVVVDSVDRTIATQFTAGRMANNPLDKTMSDFILYPNPASGNINLSLYEVLSRDACWRITDIYGSLKLNGTIQAGNSRNTINISELHDGLYQLQLESEGNFISKTFTLIR